VSAAIPEVVKDSRGIQESWRLINTQGDSGTESGTAGGGIAGHWVEVSISELRSAIPGGHFENKCPTNFSLSPSFDKLKLVGHQTDPLPWQR
jgi:hypothetical protein